MTCATVRCVGATRWTSPSTAIFEIQNTTSCMRPRPPGDASPATILSILYNTKKKIKASLESPSPSAALNRIDAASSLNLIVSVRQVAERERERDQHFIHCTTSSPTGLASFIHSFIHSLTLHPLVHHHLAHSLTHSLLLFRRCRCFVVVFSCFLYQRPI